MTGTAEYASVPEVCAAVIREKDRVEPSGAEVQAAGHRVYQALYPAINAAPRGNMSAMRFPRNQ